MLSIEVTGMITGLWSSARSISVREKEFEASCDFGELARGFPNKCIKNRESSSAMGSLDACRKLRPFPNIYFSVLELLETLATSTLRTTAVMEP